jgi:hypothetical protein
MRKFPVGKLNEFKQEHLGALISRILNSRYEFAHGRARGTFAVSLPKELNQRLAHGPRAGMRTLQEDRNAEPSPVTASRCSGSTGTSLDRLRFGALICLFRLLHWCLAAQIAGCGLNGWIIPGDSRGHLDLQPFL